VRRQLVALLITVVAAACSSGVSKPNRVGAAGAGQNSGAHGGSMDAGTFANADAAALAHRDAAQFRDAEVAADAFFINDPPPPYCGPDGSAPNVEKPGGTPSCPSDKNRQGCPCPTVGATATCWPGQRARRGHGICKDGMTTCEATLEFNNRWGPCEGYVLPDPKALSGPRSCGCFSAGQWALRNLSPCVVVGTQTYLTSSKILADGGVGCGDVTALPPPAPVDPWTDSTLMVDCSGQFKLCFTIKAGDFKHPMQSDCVIAKSCVETWYPEPGKTQTLPQLPGWASSDPVCSAQFDQTGGYGEMSVIGVSGECEKVDDGLGAPYVFQRGGYCPSSCSQTPTAPACQMCQSGGSGQFGAP
jgi:hypothetical protein